MSGFTSCHGRSSKATTCASSTAVKAPASTTCKVASISTASPVSGSSTPGHGRHEIAQAYADQAARLGYASAMTYTTTPAVKLAEKLAELTPGDLSRVFFVSGGSEAVETAIKIAKQVQAMRGFPKRYKIIARRRSYHGMTYGAMSVTATRNETWFGPFMYGVYHVPHPDRYRSDFGVEGEEADLMAARYVEQEIVSQGPETVAAVIGEPISTAAGVHVPSPKYWQMLREICDRHGVLLIADEVINGFGRTGTMFATEQFGFVPDIMTMAKGLSSGYAPIAAAIVRDSVYDVFKENKEAVMGHLLTFGGHPAACAAALKNLEIFERRGSGWAERAKGAAPEVPTRGAPRPSHGRRRARSRADVRYRSGQEQGDTGVLGQNRRVHRASRSAGSAARAGDSGLGRHALRAAAGRVRSGDRPHGGDC